MERQNIIHGGVVVEITDKAQEDCKCCRGRMCREAISRAAEEVVPYDTEAHSSMELKAMVT